MGTPLNTAKDVLKKNANAQELQRISVPGYTADGEQKLAVVSFPEKVREARKATIEANEGNRLVLDLLEKDSKHREKYQAMIDKNNHFLDHNGEDA